MKKFLIILIMSLIMCGLLASTSLIVSAAGDKEELLGSGMIIYMQMGGTEGDPSTLARTNGARAAAKHLGVKLIEQYSAWQPEKMINQFKEALAASPDGIVIMGHPGEGAFESLVEEATSRGIIVTSGNNPLPNLQAKYQDKGFGYAGADLHAGGYLTGQAMIKQGLKSGDKALVYGLFSQEGRRKSPMGIVDALEDVGLVVEKLDISPEVDTEASLCIPILTAYLERNPDVKAIGTQHGNVTSNMMKVLQAAGKKPGEVIVGGIDLSPATIEGIEKGYVSASFDQMLYLQGFFPVLQVVLMKKYNIPGLDINTGVGIATPQNIGELKTLIEKGVR